MPTAEEGDPYPGGPGDEGHRRRMFRRRSVALAVLVIGVWLGVLVDPVFGPLTWWVAGGFGLTVLILLAAMGLSWVGFGLFAAGDRVAGWIKRLSNWPDQ